MTAYPRPQLVREQWTSLNGSWKFLFDNEFNYNQPDKLTFGHCRLRFLFRRNQRPAVLAIEAFIGLAGINVNAICRLMTN